MELHHHEKLSCQGSVGISPEYFPACHPRIFLFVSTERITLAACKQENFWLQLWVLAYFGDLNLTPLLPGEGFKNEVTPDKSADDDLVLRQSCAT